MKDWYYYNKNGEKVGPISTADMKLLAEQGSVVPETLIENSNGRSTLAGQVKGLTFLEMPFGPSTESEQPFVPLPTPAAPPISTTSPMNGQNSPLLSRAVFIFLAVFVGLFGIHDFYAKRVRHGWIHLALLLAWILVFLASVLTIFGMTLYAITYDPNRRERQECSRQIKATTKDIKVCEKDIAEMEQKIKEVRDGKLWKPKPIPSQPDDQRTITPQQPSNQQRIVTPQQPSDQQRAVTPQQPSPQQRTVIPQQPNNQPRTIAPQKPNHDVEYVQELELELGRLRSRLYELGEEKTRWEGNLIRLKAQQSIESIPAWVSVGPLWAYFFFFVLPFASWVMAMIEIIYVTKDGTGREFGF